MEQFLSFFQLKSQVLLLAAKTFNGRLVDIHLELHLRVLFLAVLRLVTEQIKRVLDLLRPDIILLQLTALNGKFSPRRVELFPLLGDLGHILSFLSLKCGDLLIPLHELLVELLNLFLGGTEI